MPRHDEFDFSGDSVAISYDEVLVPVLFRPWAERLAAEHGPWDGRRVLDLATGTGVVAQVLADRVGGRGHVIATDVNSDMLRLARKRCGDHGSTTFVESAAHPLDVASASVDRVVCQQGFQFFPEPRPAAAEVLRVLRAGGRVVISCWRDVDRCQFFGAICETLRGMGEAALSDLMRLPFVQDGLELRSTFESAGFVEVALEEQEMPFVFESVGAAVGAAYSTPIGPRLRSLPDAVQARFRAGLAARLATLGDDGRTMGRMVSYVLTARKSEDAPETAGASET
jgi:SAM-dependent methyltransferase